MFLENLLCPAGGPGTTLAQPRTRRPAEGVDSEYGRLQSVLLADPGQLALIPCNSVSEEAIRDGRDCCRLRAGGQHRKLAAALGAEGVEVRIVPADQRFPDLAFTRDTSLMTPWGLLGLRPGAPHRAGEVDAVMAAAASSGVAVFGRIASGRIEGGDVAMIRPGLIAIGVSGNRTDDDGAEVLAALYRRHGWEVIRYPLDPHFLHLDTIFCMVDRNLAVACTEVLEAEFVERVADLGIELVPLAYEEARRLGCNLLSLGDRRVVTSSACPRLDSELAALGYRPIPLDLSDFAMCGGGVHCLTMPLRRAAG